jgi:hypothetical protein
VPPGQSGRNGHARAQREDGEGDPLAPAATTGATATDYSAGRGFTVSLLDEAVLAEDDEHAGGPRDLAAGGQLDGEGGDVVVAGRVTR